METTTKRQTPRRRKHKSNNFRYYVSEGFKGLFSHGFMSAAAIIIIAACLLITLQDVLGVLVGNLIGMDPYLALQCSSASMSGGVGTASAFGPIFIDKFGAPDSATTVGVAAGTMGNIMGSLIGGPLSWRRHSMKSSLQK